MITIEEKKKNESLKETIKMIGGVAFIISIVANIVVDVIGDDK